QGRRDQAVRNAPLAAEDAGQRFDAARDDVRRRGGEAEAHVRGVGAEAGAGGDEQPALDAVLEEALEAAAVQLLGDVEEEEGAALGSRQAKARRRPLAGFPIELTRLRDPVIYRLG